MDTDSGLEKHLFCLVIMHHEESDSIWEWEQGNQKLENTTDRKIERTPEFDSLSYFSPRPIIHISILKLYPKVFLMITIHN